MQNVTAKVSEITERVVTIARKCLATIANLYRSTVRTILSFLVSKKTDTFKEALKIWVEQPSNDVEKQARRFIQGKILSSLEEIQNRVVEHPYFGSRYTLAFNIQILTRNGNKDCIRLFAKEHGQILSELLPRIYGAAIVGSKVKASVQEYLNTMTTFSGLWKADSPYYNTLFEENEEGALVYVKEIRDELSCCENEDIKLSLNSFLATRSLALSAQDTQN
ncbi:MAG: hypothetical protein S4CHLAM37_07970 [Chlamydiia bacterium]|nr:hypothetical protein [Chlamydiia bacterium]